MRTLDSWADFEPEGDREEMAYALMTAGHVVDVPGIGVKLDLEMADRVLEALNHRDLELAPKRSDSPYVIGGGPAR